ncbi:hypothetical protein [Candidatus Bealeia paramacronuclearis]|uniref:hypothetical protein n=1 Tax=Candidatus Bealeia paramacronuclearis TaxID=1921001 RepID=UPI002F26BE08
MYKLSLTKSIKHSKGTEHHKVTKVICPCHKEYIQPVESKQSFWNLPTNAIASEKSVVTSRDVLEVEDHTKVVTTDLMI